MKSPKTWRIVRSAYEHRHEPESLRVLAGIYWYATLTIIGLLVSGVVFYGVWHFVALSGASATPAEVIPRGTGSAFDVAQLEAVLSGLDARGSLYETLNANPSRFADPSR